MTHIYDLTGSGGPGIWDWLSWRVLAQVLAWRRKMSARLHHHPETWPVLEALLHMVVGQSSSSPEFLHRAAWLSLWQSSRHPSRLSDPRPQIKSQCLLRPKIRSQTPSFTQLSYDSHKSLWEGTKLGLQAFIRGKDGDPFGGWLPHYLYNTF